MHERGYSIYLHIFHEVVLFNFAGIWQYGISVMLSRNAFLVDRVEEEMGTVLKLEIHSKCMATRGRV